MSGLAPAARNSIRMGLGAGGGHRQITSALGGNDMLFDGASLNLTQEHHGITLFLTSATGDQVLNLPQATAGMVGLKYRVMTVTSPSGAGVSIVPASDQAINGGADGAAVGNTTKAAGDYHELIFDGTGWRSLGFSGTWG